MNLRDLAAHLPGDRGEPLTMTPLVEDAIASYEGDFATRVFVSPRRNGKSTACALLAAWELLAVPNAFVVWVSGSGDQAADILSQKLRWPLRTSWAFRGVRLQDARDRVANPELGSTVQVLAPAEVSAPGRTISLLVVDEARGVPEEVYEVLRPSAAGGRIYVIGSPGPPRGWFHRAATEPGPRDFVRHYTAISNPAIDPAFVDGERARLARRGAWGEAMAAREWSASWVELAEHPLVSPADVRRGSVRPEDVEPFDQAGDVVAVGVDLSTHKDLTSAVAVARGRDDRLRVLEAFVWDPASRGPVDLGAIGAKLEEMAAAYRPVGIVVDRYQAVALVQSLRAKGLPVRDAAVTPALNAEAFGALAEALSAGRLRWARSDRLEAELLNLELGETAAGGIRVADRDRRLHRDVSFALALAVLEAGRAARSGAGPVLLASSAPARGRPRVDRNWRSPREDPFYREEAAERRARPGGWRRLAGSLFAPDRL